MPDSVVRSASYANTQNWPNVHEAPNYSWLFASGGGQAATIAIVDSGVDTTRADIAGRVLTQVNFTTLTPNSAGDGRGWDLRREHRGRCGHRLLGYLAELEARLAGRARGQRRGRRQRRDRGGRLDLRQPVVVQHPRRELLAHGLDRLELHVRPARPGRREALVLGSRGRGRGRQLRGRRRHGDGSLRARERPVRDHRRRRRLRRLDEHRATTSTRRGRRTATRTTASRSPTSARRAGT